MPGSNSNTNRIPYKQLKALIQELPIPKEPIPYKQGETISNVSLFLDSHYAVVEANSGNKMALPYYTRLLEYYNFIVNKR